MSANKASVLTMKSSLPAGNNETPQISISAIILD